MQHRVKSVKSCRVLQLVHRAARFVVCGKPKTSVDGRMPYSLLQVQRCPGSSIGTLSDRSPVVDVDNRKNGCGSKKDMRVVLKGPCHESAEGTRKCLNEQHVAYLQHLHRNLNSNPTCLAAGDYARQAPNLLTARSKGL